MPQVGVSVGGQVFAMAADTYAELRVVNAAIFAKIPKGLDLIQAAALPLATTTVHQLSATGIKAMLVRTAAITNARRRSDTCGLSPMCCSMVIGLLK
jgi:NADPH:quinone reductase-like Zn-dependent oxidoreductase